MKKHWGFESPKLDLKGMRNELQMKTDLQRTRRLASLPRTHQILFLNQKLFLCFIFAFSMSLLGQVTPFLFIFFSLSLFSKHLCSFTRAIPTHTHSLIVFSSWNWLQCNLWSLPGRWSLFFTFLAWDKTELYRYTRFHTRKMSTLRLYKSDYTRDVRTKATFSPYFNHLSPTLSNQSSHLFRCLFLSKFFVRAFFVAFLHN